MAISLNPCVSSCCLHVGPPIQTKGSDPRWNHQPAGSCWEGRGCGASHMNTESSGSTHFPTATPKLQAAYSCSCLEEGKGREGERRCKADCAPSSLPNLAHNGGWVLASPRNLAFKELSQCGDTAKPCASKDSGTQPWSSFLGLGALHLTSHTNHRHQLPMQMQPSEGISRSGIQRHHGPLHRRAPQHWWAAPCCMLPFTRSRLLPPQVKII